MMTTLIGLCLAVSGAGPGAQSPAYRAAYEMGRAEADREFDRGAATLYVYGLPGESLDRATGLRFKAISGCMVDDAILGRAAGHNDRIAESIKARGLPRNSYKRWEKELFDLLGSFSARGRLVEPQRLPADGAEVASPEGTHTFRLRDVPRERRSPASEPQSELVITSDGATFAVPLASTWMVAGKLEVLPGPEGSPLAFVRWSDFPPGSDIEQIVGAFDVKTGEFLRHEIENRRAAGARPNGK